MSNKDKTQKNNKTIKVKKSANFLAMHPTDVETYNHKANLMVALEENITKIRGQIINSILFKSWLMLRN